MEFLGRTNSIQGQEDLSEQSVYIRKKGKFAIRFQGEKGVLFQTVLFLLES